MELLEERFEERGFNYILKKFPFLLELENVMQEPEYHAEGTVFIHTKMVCESLISSKEWETLNKAEKRILYLAALFHDIGKKECTRIENGRIVSPYHAVQGAKLFREQCYFEYEAKYGIGFSEREQIVSLIRYHGLPLLFMEKTDVDRTIRRAACQVNLKLLYLLAKADLKGRISKARKLLEEQVDYFMEYTTELGCFEKKPEFPNEYTKYKYLKGDLDWYGTDLYEPPSFPVYVLSGLPLSGKDTYIEKHWHTLPIISLDEIRQDLGILPSQNSSKVVALAKEQAKKLLREKQSFVWNATNLTRELRGKLCRLFENYGASVSILYLEAPYQELLIRNQVRDRKIPQKVLEHMIKRMEIVLPWEGRTVEYFISDRNP